VEIMELADLQPYWDEVEPLVRELIEYHEPLEPFRLIDDWPDRLKARYAEPDSVVFLAWRDGHPVGFADARLLTDPSIFRERFVAIGNMYVRSGHRRLGIGSRLLEAVDRWAAERAARQLRLNVVAPNEEAIAFYAASGFEPWIIGMRRRFE
jgi:GNAT superfamily N-acetyltransferase